MIFSRHLFLKLSNLLFIKHFIILIHFGILFAVEVVKIFFHRKSQTSGDWGTESHGSSFR